MTKEMIANLLDSQKRICAICRADLVDMKWQLDHKIPRSLGGSDDIDNIQATCQPCNQGKWNFSQDQYIAHCIRVAEANQCQPH